MNRRRSLLLALGGLAYVGAPARAQSWPLKTIRIVVGYAAGGSTDITARYVAQGMAERLGQAVIVDNRPGASGNIAAEYVAKAAPDGYTLLMSTSAAQAANPTLYPNLPFDVTADFTPITQTAFIPNLLVVGAGVPVSSVAELIGYAKANPGRLNFGSTGSGSSQHLAGELFDAMAGVKMVHVAYRGGALAVNDLLSGQIQVLFAPLVEVLQQVRAGSVKALGITTKDRSPLLPEVPPVAEALPGFELVLWNGLYGPARLPPDIVARINAAAVAALQSDDMRQKFAAQGSSPVGSTPEAFGRFQASEIAKWRELVKISGATIQ